MQLRGTKFSLTTCTLPKLQRLAQIGLADDKCNKTWYNMFINNAKKSFRNLVLVGL